MEDICDFIVEYINSDVMVRIRHMLMAMSSIFCDLQGLLADRHIIIADQSKVTCCL